MNLPGPFRASLVLLVLTVSSLAAPLKPFPHVDLARYGGPWRVIAFMDNSKERELTDAVESYRINRNKEIDVHFTFQKKSVPGVPKVYDFTGRVGEDESNAIWKMQLIPKLPFLSVKYVIIDVAPDYSVATVAHPSRKYGWILARAKTISPAAWQRSVHALQAQGYDTSRLVRMPQPPDPRRRHGARR